MPKGEPAIDDGERDAEADEASVGCRRPYCPYLHVPLLGVAGAENALSSLCAEVRWVDSIRSSHEHV